MGWFIGTPLWMWAVAGGISLAGLLKLIADMESGDCGAACDAYHSSGYGKE